MRTALGLRPATIGNRRPNLFEGIGLRVREAPQEADVDFMAPEDAAKTVSHIKARDVVKPLVGVGPRFRLWWCCYWRLGCGRRPAREMWEPSKKYVEQLVRIDWLDDVIVHPRRNRPFAITGHRIRRHGEDRQGVKRGQRADLPCRFETIHHGHLEIHEHEVELKLLDAPHAFLAVQATTVCTPTSPSSSSATC